MHDCGTRTKASTIAIPVAFGCPWVLDFRRVGEANLDRKSTGEKCFCNEKSAYFIRFVVAKDTKLQSDLK